MSKDTVCNHACNLLRVARRVQCDHRKPPDSTDDPGRAVEKVDRETRAEILRGDERNPRNNVFSLYMLF